MSQAKLKLPRAVSLAAERADSFLSPPPVEIVEPTIETPPATEPVTEVVPTTTTTPTQERDASYFEHRMKTVQGMHEADKRRFKETEDRLKQEIDQLRNSITQLQTTIPREYDLRKYLSEEEIADYGEDRLKVSLKAAVKATRDELSSEYDRKLQETVAPVQQQLVQMQEDEHQRKVSHFFDILNTAVPNWEAINQDQAWLNWLDEVDPFTQETRQSLLTRAEQALDGRRVANFFKVFLQSVAAEQAAKQAALAAQAQPPTVTGGAPNTNAGQQPIYTAAFVQKFYNDLARGVYKSRPKEAAEIEQRINLAFAKGLIK